MPKPIVAIVGRPNVGKSTLYNRLIKRRHAIVDDQPGVTRDRLASDMTWNGLPFTLVDTGGLMASADEEIDALVSAAAEAAIDEADKVVFVVDGKLGLTDLDVAVARKVQRAGVPVVLAVTKVDRVEDETVAFEYYSLGLGDPIPVSGLNGMNTGDLLDRIIEGLEVVEEERQEGEIRLALLGRPNVGKSSLLNRLIGREAQIVSEVPGTTRDAIDFTFLYEGRPVTLIDTAGLRRKDTIGKGQSLDYYTALRTLKAVERCDVAAVMLDASEGLTQYERRLLDDVRDRGKGVIALYNKWDLVEKETGTMRDEEEEFRLQLPDLSFAPLLFISALTGQRARKLLDVALAVADARASRVTTSALNRYFEKVVEMTPPPSVKGKWLKIKYVSQVATEPPVLAFHLNYPELIPGHYQRFLERKLREEFGFEGVPVRIVFRKK